MERRLSRREMIAAELFSYSYANYADHLGIGNARFEELMPQEVELLERAEREEWDKDLIAEELDMPMEEVQDWLERFKEAKEIIDAPSPVKSFRLAVRQAIEHAIEEGLDDLASVERLVTQVCYRTADLAYRLDSFGDRLSDYSEELREETEYDEEYWNKWFSRQSKREPRRDNGAA